MAKIYGQLEYAQFHVLSSDSTSTATGMMWWNSTSGLLKSYDGAAVRAFLRNDGKAVIGNNGTANNNIRLHRGASSVLQFVQGGDTTAEGSLSTTLAQISGKQEGYAAASLPAAGNAGRVLWVTDSTILKVDNGSAWKEVFSELSVNAIGNAHLRQSSGLSVIGRSANSTGNVADIIGTDGQVFRVSGTTLGFGTIATAGIADSAVDYTKVAAGAHVQMVSSVDGAVNTGSAQIPHDDSVPQSNEGDQYLSVTITPKATTHKLEISVIVYGTAGATGVLSVALFQDATANALAAVGVQLPSINELRVIPLNYVMTAGTTSATTFKVRMGASSAGTTTFNGVSAGRKFGGVAASSIVVREVKA